MALSTRLLSSLRVSSLLASSSRSCPFIRSLSHSATPMPTPTPTPTAGPSLTIPIGTPRTRRTTPTTGTGTGTGTGTSTGICTATSVCTASACACASIFGIESVAWSSFVRRSGRRRMLGKDACAAATATVVGSLSVSGLESAPRSVGWQISLRAFHGSAVCNGRGVGVSGASGIWSSAKDFEDHAPSKEDLVDLGNLQMGKFHYLDAHPPTPAPLPTTARVDDQLARMAAIEQQQHLLKRTIEERHRVFFADAKRRYAEDPYNDMKTWFGGDPEPPFSISQLFWDAMRMLVLGGIFSFVVHLVLLPFGKLLGIPIPNPALGLMLRVWYSANDLLERVLEEKTAWAAGEAAADYEAAWLDALADKVIFKMKNPGAALPIEDKLFLFPFVVQSKPADTAQQLHNTLHALTHGNGETSTQH